MNPVAWLRDLCFRPTTLDGHSRVAMSPRKNITEGL